MCAWRMAGKIVHTSLIDTGFRHIPHLIPYRPFGDPKREAEILRDFSGVQTVTNRSSS